ncbi:MAG: DNA repair protein RadA [Oscillospiraceae bacterium]|jgi:DNA repair protein RadA/Sms|nr:DNA repair protein RadA [Oscillospiraceae bacterium]
MKLKSIYVCSECGAVSPKWSGKCADCGSWNTINEEVTAVPKKGGGISATGNASVSRLLELSSLNSDTDEGKEIRVKTGTGELDRVLGGGLVKGSLVLISGEPGIGKSTLLLQICGALSRIGKVLYVSGEESTAQIKMRAKRLGVTAADTFLLASSTDMDAVIAVTGNTKPDVLIIDSIQTMTSENVPSAPASVTQVRECTHALLKLAKSSGVSIFIVGHVNKDGGIAGPKVLEHIVDTVLYFEGERQSDYRILRAEKNRFGSTNEIGVFEMGNKGLSEVPNPSAIMLSGRPAGVSGITVFPAMEGGRAVLTEIQVLAAKNPYGGTPRRTSDGFDGNRLSLLIAVLEKRAGYAFSVCDVYLNIVGGLRITEPASDLAVAAALFSALCDRAIPDGMALFGEIGLGGEIRAVSRAAERVAEAKRMGFTRIIVPNACMNGLQDKTGIEIRGVNNLQEVFTGL